MDAHPDDQPSAAPDTDRVFGRRFTIYVPPTNGTGQFVTEFVLYINFQDEAGEPIHCIPTTVQVCTGRPPLLLHRRYRRTVTIRIPGGNFEVLR
jgi:hypothetical protein